MAGCRICPVAASRFFSIDVVPERLAGDMTVRGFSNKSWIRLLSITVFAVGSYSLATGAVSLFTPDQQGYRFYERGEFGKAAI